MLKDMKGKKVTVYMNFSAWGDTTVSGLVVDSSDSWLELKGKKTTDFISVDTIKRVTVHSK